MIRNSSSINDDLKWDIKYNICILISKAMKKIDLFPLCKISKLH